MIGKRAKVGWLVSRREEGGVLGEENDARGPGRERGRKDTGEGKSEEDEEILPKEFLFTLATSNRTGGGSLKKRIYNLLLLAGAT